MCMKSRCPVLALTLAVFNGFGVLGQLRAEATPAQQKSDLNLKIELPTILSDTRGVDFGPYLRRLIETFRQSGLAQIPQSALQSEQGRVGLVCEILKDGSVPKVRLVASAGSDALDRATADALHALIPFPRLPKGFTGGHMGIEFFSFTPIRVKSAGGARSRALPALLLGSQYDQN